MKEKVPGTEQRRARPSRPSTAQATFGAGCFWGVEEAFRIVNGVIATQVGYMGGLMKNPTYEEVCAGQTGHIEVVQIEYDPSVVSYRTLLDIFWNIHDPTSKDRQGPDSGTQYRSVIFYHTPEQKAIADGEKARLAQSKKYRKPVVTEIRPAQTFYRAEEYHQKYLIKRALRTC